MGREIRRVPPNWESPKSEDGQKGPQPMYDKCFEKVSKNWKEEFKQWEEGTHECVKNWPDTEFWEYNSPPQRKYYRPWKDEEATWYQVWETISEGTPVTPAFKTTDELCDYLANKGDYWDQLREIEKCSFMSGGPWGRERAEAFIKEGHVATMIFVINDKGIKIYESKDIALEHEKRKNNGK